MSSSSSPVWHVWGPKTRTLMVVFDQLKNERDHLHVQKLREACNKLGLYPSTSQVFEMVVCAVEYGSPCEPDHITFGEFCVLVAELQDHYAKNPAPPQPRCLTRSRARSDFHGSSKRKCKPESLPSFQVFLGGSCNPTTWRTEIAIPFLKEHGITFYNPVQNWTPELMELEDQAKQTSDVLFFVLDNETRGISSMIETAFLVASGRQVVVVMKDYKGPDVQICGETLTESELGDIMRARIILTDLVERNSVPVFKCIHKALKCTEKLLNRNLTVKDLTLEDDGVSPVRFGYLRLGEALLRLREAFSSVDNTKSGQLNIQDIFLAYKCCYQSGRDSFVDWLKQRRKPNKTFLYEEFCCVVTEFRDQLNKGSTLQKFWSAITTPIRWLANALSHHHPSTECDDVDEGIRDVYLGGSCGKSMWRDEVAIPKLQKNGLSFFNPRGSMWDQKLIPIHVANREKCRILLYNINNETRSFASMIEAGYYIGKGCRVVLCLRKFVPDMTVYGEKMSENGIRDYNRGRDYLKDLASRGKVPLFDNVAEAVQCVIDLVGESSS